MNEWLMLGLVGVIVLVAGLGASWLGRAISSNNKNNNKPS